MGTSAAALPTNAERSRAGSSSIRAYGWSLFGQKSAVAPVRLTLLGTGMPQPDPRRHGPSQVIDANGDLVLVDCGAGTLHRLMDAGYDGRMIKRIAITHLHSDHITGLADVLWAGWVQRWWQGPPDLVGPPGTAEFVRRLVHAFEYDITVRTAEGSLSAETLMPKVVEIDDGRMIEDGSCRLTAFRVDHAPVDQAFGYRVDSDEGSVVVSGDTRRSENLIKYARGTDLLVHEVIWRTGMRRLIDGAPDELQRARLERVLDYHTPADEVGQVAARAGAGHLILSHIVAPGGTPEDLAGDVRRGYDGMLTVGEDLAAFTVDRKTR